MMERHTNHLLWLDTIRSVVIKHLQNLIKDLNFLIEILFVCFILKTKEEKNDNRAWLSDS